MGMRVKKHVVRIALGLLVVLAFLGHAAGYYELPYVNRLEAMAYDTRLRITMPRTMDPRITIVDIDERSLAVEGRWPWRRDRLGLLLDKLFDEYRVRVVGFDVVFAERDESSGLAVLRALARDELRSVPGFQASVEALAPKLDFDRIFADKLRGRPVALGYYFTDEGQKISRLPQPVLPKGIFHGRNISVVTMTGYGANLPALQAAAATAGHFNPLTDEDGVTRRVPMLVEYEGAYYEPLSMAMLRLLVGDAEVRPGLTAGTGWSKRYPGLEWLDVGSIRIPVDREVSALVPYRGPKGSFAYVSATDVLSGKAPRAHLEGHIVLVGTTTRGLMDLRSTPVGTVYPGVEIHANLISGMLDGRVKQMPAYVLGAQFILLALAGPRHDAGPALA